MLPGRLTAPMAAALAAYLFAPVGSHAAAPVTSDLGGEAFSASAATLQSAATGAKAGPGDDVVVLMAEGHYSFDDQGRATISYRRVFKVVTRTGAESWGSVSVDYAPWYQAEPTIRVRVLSPDGQFHELDQKTVTRSTPRGGSDHIYSDYLTVEAPLPAMAPGAIVEQEITKTDLQPFFSGGHNYNYYFSSSAPVQRSRLTIEGPRSLKLRYRPLAVPDLSVTKSRSGGRMTLVFERGPTPADEDAEPGMPPDVPFWPRVSFSTGRSWNAAARAYGKLLRPQLTSGIDEIAFTPTSTGRVEIAREALAFVQANVRYTGLEFGQSAIVPWTPQETWQRKYGDCKDKATLLAALLRRAGVKAQVALVRSGGSRVEPKLPGIGHFNHAIVYLPGKPALWVDPTYEFARVGELPTVNQGRLALIIDDHTKGLTMTPRAVASDNRVVEEREYRLRDHGPARIVERTLPTGAYERSYRSGYLDADPKKQREQLAGYVKTEYLADELTSYRNSEPIDLTVPFELTIEVDKSIRGETFDSVALVYLFPADLLSRFPSAITRDAEASDKPRVNPFRFSPFQFEQRYRIVPPTGFEPRSLPHDLHHELGGAELNVRYRREGDEVHATLTLDSGSGDLTAEQFELLRTRVKELQKLPSSEVAFDQVGMRHLAAGHIREAIAEFQRLAKQLPKKARPRSLLAKALLQAGLGSEAAAEARHAIAVEPTSADAHAALGWILQHDRFGRRFGPGYARSAAIHAYQRAIALEPKTPEYHADLAILLARDGDGWPYSGDLRGAIVEYKAAKVADPDYHHTDYNLLATLVYADDFAGLQQEVKAWDNPEKYIEFSVAAAAALHGAPAALELARRSTSTRAEERTALAEAADHLIQSRRYAPAADLLDAAAAGADNESAIRGRVVVLRRCSRTTLDKLPADSAKELVREFLALAIEGGADSEKKALALLAKPLRREMRASPELFRQQLGSLNSMNAQGLTRAGLRDVSLGAIEFHEEESPYGYRVTMQAPGGKALGVYYIVREGKNYRLLALQGYVASVGVEVLRLARSGDLEGARQWLDWVSDAIAFPVIPGGDRKSLDSLWTASGPRDRDRIEFMGTLLLAQDRTSKQALRRLRKCPEGTGEVTQACERTLFAMLYTQRQWNDYFALANRIASDMPEALRAGRLMLAGHLDEAEVMITAALAKDSNDLRARALLASLAARRGDLAEHVRLYRELSSDPKEGASYANGFAWGSLFVAGPHDDALAAAQRAVTSSRRTDASTLNTLAAVHAARGELAVAYQTMLESMTAAGRFRLEPSDYVVYGKIAEGYGYTATAKWAYGLAVKADIDSPVSSYQLARKWASSLK